MEEDFVLNPPQEFGILDAEVEVSVTVDRHLHLHRLGRIRRGGGEGGTTGEAGVRRLMLSVAVVLNEGGEELSQGDLALQIHVKMPMKDVSHVLLGGDGEVEVSGDSGETLREEEGDCLLDRDVSFAASQFDCRLTAYQDWPRSSCIDVSAVFQVVGGECVSHSSVRHHVLLSSVYHVGTRAMIKSVNGMSGSHNRNYMSVVR